MATSTPWTALLNTASADIVAGRPALLSVEQARDLNLEAWCFHRAEAASAYRRELAGDFANAWMRHRGRMRVLAPLLAAWRQAGVQVCAFKGAAMALLAYPHPALRHAGDIDLVVDPAQAELARRCVTADWAVVTEHLNDDIAFYLLHRSEGTLVEMHHSLVPFDRMGSRASAALTRAMLSSACAVPFDIEPGSRCELPCLAPVDLMLSLIINRSWSDDAWRHRPHDYLDLHGLATRQGVSAEALRRRAEQLGALATVETFLGSCDPWAGRFDMLAAYRSRWARWRRDLALLPGHVPPQVVHAFERARRAPGVVWRMLVAAPVVLGVIRELARNVSPIEAASRPVAIGRRRWRPWQVVQAVEWATWLLRQWIPSHLAGPCVLQSLSVHRIMRSQGLASTWQLGHAIGPGGVRLAHAWVLPEDPYAFGIDHAIGLRRYVAARPVPVQNAQPAKRPDLRHAVHPPS